MQRIPKTLVFDLLAVGGGGLLVYGLSLVWLPLAWIVPGAGLLAVGIWGSWRCS